LRYLVIFISRTSSAGALLGHIINTLRLASSAFKNYKTLQKVSGFKAGSIFLAIVATYVFNSFLTVVFLNASIVHNNIPSHNYCI
jgi:succinate dehydrogenase/fumarate reductase cytochrome b subunit